MIIDEKRKDCPVYPIRPHHINTKQHFWNAFGNQETEVSAYWVVRFCQLKDCWFSFTQKEIEAYTEGRFNFNQLLRDNCSVDFQPIIQGDSGRYYLTHFFITKCFLSSPCLENQKEIK